MVGELSRYEKKILTFPNADNLSNWDKGAVVPCSFTPKIIVVYGGPEENGHIINGVIALSMDNATINRGVFYGITASGSVIDYAYTANSSAAAQRFKYENGTLYICRAAATVYWHNDISYTFEIYG